jgi:hypothetical protein
MCSRALVNIELATQSIDHQLRRTYGVFNDNLKNNSFVLASGDCMVLQATALRDVIGQSVLLLYVLFKPFNPVQVLMPERRRRCATRRCAYHLHRVGHCFSLISIPFHLASPTVRVTKVFHNHVMKYCASFHNLAYFCLEP